MKTTLKTANFYKIPENAIIQNFFKKNSFIFIFHFTKLTKQSFVKFR